MTDSAVTRRPSFTPVRVASGQGMACSACGHDDTDVKDSRPAKLYTIRRRRQCSRCGHRFTTYEISEDIFGPIENAIDLDTMIRQLRSEDVALLKTIVAEMRKRGRRPAP